MAPQRRGESEGPAKAGPNSESTPTLGEHAYWTLEPPAVEVEFQAIDFNDLERDVYADTARFVDVAAGGRLKFGPTGQARASCRLHQIPVVGGSPDTLHLRLVVGGFAFFPSVPRTDLATNMLAGDVVLHTTSGEPLAWVAKGSAVQVGGSRDGGRVQVCADPPECTIRGATASLLLTNVYDTESNLVPHHDVDMPEVQVDREMSFSITDSRGEVQVDDVRTDTVKIIEEGSRVEVVFRWQPPHHDSNRIALHGYLEKSELARIQTEPDMSSRLFSQHTEAPAFTGAVVHPRPDTWLHGEPDDDTKYARTILSRPVELLIDNDRPDGWIKVGVPTPWGVLPGYMRKNDTTPTAPQQPQHSITRGRLIPTRCLAE